MPSPHPAVTPEAIEIAKKYGKTVSRGIIEMERIIIEQEKKTAFIEMQNFKRARGADDVWEQSW
jgi:hypothetical protein